MSAAKTSLAVAALVMSGCYDSYLVSESDWKARQASSMVAAKVVRESDRRRLVVRSDSVRIDDRSLPAPPAGQVRVRSSRARFLWPAAAILTTLGGAMAIAGPSLALPNFCVNFDHPCDPDPVRDARFSQGVGIGIAGDVIVTIGTILFGVAAGFESQAEVIEPEP